ncbi:ankyrin repeat domain-containing protein 33B [Ambystoma mexicanum]|uniref:ankyrin repeat domain-containing protein 33B n=1 Tax=Ambystoma mexicanum TaxID=8296 RepID=UPI0037E8F774
MVLLSGTRDGAPVVGGGKCKVEPLPQQVVEAVELDEKQDPTRDGVLAWRGAADPLPQLLAVIPTPAVSQRRSRDSGGPRGEVDEEDYEEYDDFSDLSDTRSIASDDSFYPPDVERHGCRGVLGLKDENEEEEDEVEGEEFGEGSFRSWDSVESPEPLSVFGACCSNNPVVLKALIRQGVSEADVQETDRNHRTGLLVACYQGYVDIVIALSQCPYVDVNWQDNEGNTALITASQAGHITTTNYLLNYYPGLDIEKRNIHGFTALMKACMQGRLDCVRALLLAGADMHATDPRRGMTPLEWARFTGRYETSYLVHKLLSRPSAEQFSDRYKPEWPKMKELLAKSNETKTCMQKILECIRSTLTFNFFNDPEEDGVMDHMVRMTTALSSPFISVACRTVCPETPPSVGKRRYAVQEILREQSAQEPSEQGNKEADTKEKQFQESRIAVVAKKKEHRSSLQTNSLQVSQKTSAGSSRRASLLPLHLLSRSSVRPGIVIPKVRVVRAPQPTYHPERVRRTSSVKGDLYLQIPKWRYKEVKEARKKAEEEEKKKTEEAEKQKQKRRSSYQKRTFT